MLKVIRTLYFYFIISIINIFLSGTRFFVLKKWLLNNISIKVGNNTRIVGPLKIGSALKLEFGENCWIGKNLTIHGNGEIKVGNNCDFAPDITILTGSHEIGTSKRRAGKGVTFNYKIGNGSWIGAKTTLINGAYVGSGSIIGACALVTKNCESDSLYIGFPAKKVRD